MTSAELLIKRIRTPSRKDAQLLGWANNDDNVGALEKQVNFVHGLLTDFDNLFMTSDTKTAQKHAGLEWPQKVAHFARLQTPVQEVATTTALLLSRVELGSRAKSPGKARSSTG